MATSLTAAAVRRSLPAIRRELGRADQERLVALEALVPEDGRISLGAVLDRLFPGMAREAALTAFRQFRGRLRDAAAESGVRLELEADTQTRTAPQARFCWFSGDDEATVAASARSSIETEGTPRSQQDAIKLSGKRLLRYFVSYAHADAAAAQDLLDRLGHYLKASASYEFRRWQDQDLILGGDWHQEIQAAIAASDFGLLLLSPAFLASGYIGQHELPHYVARDLTQPEPGRRAAPVMLKRIPLNGELDLRGLERRQIFQASGGKAFYGQAQPRRDAFAQDLFSQILRMVATLPPPKPPSPPSPQPRLDEHLLRHMDAELKDLRLVPTRGVRVSQDKLEAAERAADSERRDALEFLKDWALGDAREPYCALLGELGMGKTTTVKAFTQELLHARASDPRVPLPIYLDLRHLGDAVKADMTLPEMLRAILRRSWRGGAAEPELTAEEVMRLVQREGAIAIFDGLDEVLVHLSAAAGQRFIREVFRLLPPTLWRGTAKADGAARPGRLLVTCRTHYFRTLRDQKTLLTTEDRDPVGADAYRALVLLPFSDDQIRDYLRLTLPGEDISRVMDTIRAVHNLQEMAERPLTLSMIARHIRQIEEWKLEGRRVTGVDLYRHMVLSWLERDTGKHRILPDHKQRLMEHFAAALWRSGQRSWSVADLEQWLTECLSAQPGLALHYPVDERELLKEDLRTATFLVREGEDSFRFAHSSLLEFFLAAHLLRALQDKRPEDWDLPMPSIETLDFLGQMLLGETGGAALGTLRSIRGGYRPRASELALRYLLLAHERGYPAIPLAGFRLEGADLNGWTIVGADDGPRLSLRGACFRGTQLRQATLRRLDLEGAEFEGAVLARAEFLDCRAPGSRFGKADLTGTVFRRCDLRRSDVADATLYRTQWLDCALEDAAGMDRAAPAVLRVLGTPPAPRPHLQAPALAAAFLGHGGGVYACAFSPDGRRIVSGGSDGTVRLWDAASGEEIARLEGHGDRVTACAFSPDGCSIVSGGDDRTVRLWDAASGEQLVRLDGHGGGVNACAFSADGCRILSGGSDGAVRLWDAASGEEIARLQGHEGGVHACALSPDERRIVSGGSDGTIRLWDATSGEEITRLQGHEGGVNACAFSLDGGRIVSGGSDGTVRLWDAASGEENARLAGHRGWVNACALSPDERRIVSGGDDHTVRLWDAVSGEEIARLEGHGDRLNACAFSPDGRRIVSGGDGTIRLWDAASGEEIVKFEGHRDGVRTCAFSPNGLRIVSGSDDGTVRLWDAASGEEIARLRGHENRVNACAFSPDGRRIVSSDNDGIVRLWDAASSEEIARLEGHEGRVMSCAFSPDGRRIVSGGDDRTVRLWDTASGEEIARFEGHEDWVRTCAFSPDGRRIASGGDDRTVRLWDAVSGEEIAKLEGHGGWVTACAFSPDGCRIVSGGSGGAVRLWNAASREEIVKLQGHKGGVNACAFSLDGGGIVSGGSDGTVRLWDAASGEEIARLEGHGDWVRACAFSPDGRRIVSGGDDGTVRLWDIDNGAAGFCVYTAADGSWAVLDQRGNRIMRTKGEAWRWLGWNTLDEHGIITRLPAEIFGPLPGPGGVVRANQTI